jgi:hypothetical protein
MKQAETLPLEIKILDDGAIRARRKDPETLDGCQRGRGRPGVILD